MTDQKSITRSSQLRLGAAGEHFFEAGGTASLEKTVIRDVRDATTISGSINLGTARTRTSRLSPCGTSRRINGIRQACQIR